MFALLPLENLSEGNTLVHTGSSFSFYRRLVKIMQVLSFFIMSTKKISWGFGGPWGGWTDLLN